MHIANLDVCRNSFGEKGVRLRAILCGEHQSPDREHWLEHILQPGLQRCR